VSLNRITRLEAIDAIRNLKARYFRCLDCKLSDELRSVFTKELKVITPDGRIYADSGADYAAKLRESLTESVSCHQGLTAEIEIIDATTAKAIWAMQDVIVWHSAHPQFGWKSLLGRGHYHETYRVEDGAWRIASLTLTRLRLDKAWPLGAASASQLSRKSRAAPGAAHLAQGSLELVIGT
jgi:hypothetical protein